jgi:hypothetical protein
MTAVAVVVFLTTKFLEGAWVVAVVIPLLIVLFARTEAYYAQVARELELGKTQAQPHKQKTLVLVPTSTVSLLTQRALSAALSLGDSVIAIAVAGDEHESEQIKRDWERWRCAVPLEVLIDPHRSLVRGVLQRVDSINTSEQLVTVLIPEIVPRKRRHEILHNQRGEILEAVLKRRSDVVVATLPFHIHD